MIMISSLSLFEIYQLLHGVDLTRFKNSQLADLFCKIQTRPLQSACPWTDQARNGNGIHIQYACDLSISANKFPT